MVCYFLEVRTLENHIFINNKNLQKIMKKWQTYLMVGIILIFIIFIFVNVKKIITTNIIKEQEKYEEWLRDNCDCVLWERLKCEEPYELIVDICRDNHKITMPLEGCSQFDCSGELINWLGEKWEKNPLYN